MYLTKNENKGLVFTLIIPIYNAEKYLCKTLDSVKKQTFSNYEVLLIDDGSTDGSEEICKEFVKKDKRFKLLQKANGGVCSARNLGIENAQGEYIVFIDSDDIIEATLLADCIQKIQESKADILLFGMRFDIEKEGEIIKSYSKSIPSVIFYNVELNTYYLNLYNNNYITSMCNRVTKSELIRKNQIRFDVKITNYEDMAFGLECLRYARKIQVLEQCYYHYIVRDDFGMSRKYKPQLSNTIKPTVELLVENISKLDLSNEIKAEAYKDIQRILWLGVANICRCNESFLKKKKSIKELCSQSWIQKNLPMEMTGNHYNDICVLLFKKKLWIAETAWNIFSNYFRDRKY